MRRPEIVEDFDREVYGRVPANAPKVNWEVVSTTEEKVGDTPVVTKKLVGHVDNSAYPAIDGRHRPDADHAGRGEGAGAGDDRVRLGFSAGVPPAESSGAEQGRRGRSSCSRAVGAMRF